MLIRAFLIKAAISLLSVTQLIICMKNFSQSNPTQINFSDRNSIYFFPAFFSTSGPN